MKLLIVRPVFDIVTGKQVGLSISTSQRQTIDITSELENDLECALLRFGAKNWRSVKLYRTSLDSFNTGQLKRIAAKIIKKRKDNNTPLRAFACLE